MSTTVYFANYEHGHLMRSRRFQTKEAATAFLHRRKEEQGDDAYLSLDCEISDIDWGR